MENLKAHPGQPMKKKNTVHHSIGRIVVTVIICP